MNQQLQEIDICLSKSDGLYLTCKGYVQYAEPENNVKDSFNVDYFELCDPKYTMEFSEWIKKENGYLESINRAATEAWFSQE